MVGTVASPVECVTYYHGISDDELANLYRSAWVYASPSTYEGFGLPYMEALASGTPVVATANPGSREVLADGEYGLLVKDAEFGDSLVNLLADADRRNALIEKGISWAEQYALDLAIDRYEELLTDLICKSRKF
jgi:glycosyltransferase involved in cell wall biosynthesis